MNITDSSIKLVELGYSIIQMKEPKVKPEFSAKKFCDMFPVLARSEDEIVKRISDKKVFTHQEQSYKSLSEGKNLILKSGTGSGKTEAWAFYALEKATLEKDFRTIAIYPTLALANDQIKRISAYAEAFGIESLQLDAQSEDEFSGQRQKRMLRAKITRSRILLTNPAYLMSQLKKYFIEKSKSIIEEYLEQASLIVVDELDFYDPRSISLLLGMLSLIANTSAKKPQIVVLTATLSNPFELGEFLKEITGREFEVIEGKKFHTENRVNIVLGKNLEKIWERVKEYKSTLINSGYNVDDSVLKSFDDFEYFKRNAYKVLVYLEALGITVPSLGIDIEEILTAYTQDDGVTIVFTPSINRAEEIARKLKMILGKGVVATHHHLINKAERKKIEDAARSGNVKILISPRTLSQGIDIGNVVRIVHIGLPENLREYLQREGRKGRREEIPFTETVIIPHSRWDRELLSQGYDAFMKWLNLPIEKTIVNPRNLYMKLFTGIIKLMSTWYKVELDELEKSVLEIGGVLRKGHSLNYRRLKYLWDRLNFYELSPPYGVKRILHSNGEEMRLESIGFCDLVELFQQGCFDYSYDSIVIGHRTIEKSKGVTAVIERKIKEVRFWEEEYLARAFEQYQEIKNMWGEESSFMKDLVQGRLTSRVVVTVYPPKKGFGMFTKIPTRVLWILSSKKPYIFNVGATSIVTRKFKAIEVPAEVHGIYRDFTYGYSYEVDERLDSRLLRLGLAYIVLALRRLEAISTGLLEYTISIIGGKKFIEIHEASAAGFIENFDWASFSEKAKSYNPDELDLILLQMIDEIGYTDFIEFNLDWKPVKEYASLILNYIAQGKNIEIIVNDIVQKIPKPAKHLKLVSVDGILESLEPNAESGTRLYLTAVSIFDGERVEEAVKTEILAFGLPPAPEYKRLESLIDDLAEYEDFKILVPTKELSGYLSQLGLKKMPKLIAERGIPVLELLSNTMNPPSLEPFIEAARYLYKDQLGSAEVMEVQEIIQKMQINQYKSLFEKERAIISSYIKSRAVAVYLAYLYHLSRNPLQPKASP